MCLNCFEWQVSFICFFKTICSLSIILSSLASSFAFSYSFSAMVKKLASVLWLISLFNSKQNIVKQNMTDVESNIWLTFLSHVKFDVVNMFYFLKLLNQFYFEWSICYKNIAIKMHSWVLSTLNAELMYCQFVILKPNLTQLANFGENTSQSFTAVPLIGRYREPPKIIKGQKILPESIQTYTKDSFFQFLKTRKIKNLSLSLRLMQRQKLFILEVFIEVKIEKGLAEKSMRR